MMDKKKYIKQGENLIVIILWGVILLTPIFLMQQNENFQWRFLKGNWRAILPFLILFLLNHYLLVPQLLFKDKKRTYFLSIVALLVLLGLTFQFNKARNPQLKPEMGKPHSEIHPPERERPHHRPNQDRQRPEPPRRRTEPPRPFNFPPLFSSLLLATLMLGFDTGLRVMVRWSQIERDKSILEKENISTQLAFLKNQLSPHFFMNTLNNIHSLMDISTDEAKESIIKLSRLMRHLLYDSDNDKISIQKEVEFINSYIELMRLRFSEKVEIKFEWDGKISDKLIPPLLFTSLLENAFKHGISYDKTSFVRINMQYENAHLHLIVENSNHKKQGDKDASGIGIVNTKKRLDLLYPHQYTFEQKETVDVFQIKLSIPI